MTPIFTSHCHIPKMAVNKEIEYIRWYRRKKLIFHGYVFPFIIIYGAVFYTWLVVYGALAHFELGCIALAVTGVIQVLTCLSCHWSVHVRCAFTCTSVRSVFYRYFLRLIYSVISLVSEYNCRLGGYLMEIRKQGHNCFCVSFYFWPKSLQIVKRKEGQGKGQAASP